MYTKVIVLIYSHRPQLDAELEKSSEDRLVDATNDIKDWEAQLRMLRELLNLADTRTELKTVTIPQLEAKVKEQEAKIPSLTEAAEKVSPLTEQLKK